ncbi:MAG: hypothetical protein Q8L48_25120 [Archangium sp.]|nr:hypothetical protein [Archangium sp.]
MNRALPIVSLCVAILALAAALIPRDPVVVAAPQVEAPRTSDAELELRKRVELLEDDSRNLWDRVVLLERRPTTTVSDAGVISPSLVNEVAQLREEVRGVMTGEVLSNDASRAALKEVIREAEADSQRERLLERQQRLDQRAVEQKAKWKDFVAAAKLTFPQEQELNRRLEAEEAARKAFAEAMQKGTPNPDAFRAIRDQRRETDQAMGKLLDDTQKQQYQAVRREDRGGRDRPGSEQLR